MICGTCGNEMQEHETSIETLSSKERGQHMSAPTTRRKIYLCLHCGNQQNNSKARW